MGDSLHTRNKVTPAWNSHALGDCSARLVTDLLKLHLPLIYDGLCGGEVLSVPAEGAAAPLPSP